MSIQNFFDKIQDDGRPWLIVGKGPTAQRLKDGIPPELNKYRFFTLNHALRFRPCAEVAHIIDVDVLDDPFMIASLYYEKSYLVMPQYPHIKQRPDFNRSLLTLTDEIPILAYLFSKNRLLDYNLNFSLTNDTGITARPPARWQELPIRAQWFSSEAAFDLLSKMGAKTIHTIGVDGGAQRAAVFSDIPFNNPHGSYDLQFRNIERMAKERGVDYQAV